MQDTTFSVVVTALFLRPIYKVLRRGDVGAQDMRSTGYKSLMKTKWMTLSGASLAVLSSTALYINSLLYFTALYRDAIQWHASPYLNFFVLGLNLDSALNDLGLLLACGVLKKFSCVALTKHFSTAASHAAMVSVAPATDGYE